MDIKIGKIEPWKYYIDKSFRKGKEKVALTKIKSKNLTKPEKYKYLETIRISVIKDSIIHDLNRIINEMPKYNELDDFYKSIFPCFIDVDKYKNALGSIRWASNNIKKLYLEINARYTKMKPKKVNDVLSVRNSFLARTESFLKQIEKNFLILEEYRKKIKDIPNIKTSLFTVAIAGFPNVGKSTLLGKITNSKPEINSYSFTTKGLMIGYIKGISNNEEVKIQAIDTPGTLNRIDKMNNIEKMAHLCIENVADIIVYVFDLTEPYPLSDQLKLYSKISSLGKKVIVYVSKSDILEEEKIKTFLKKNSIHGIYNSETIKEEILKSYIHQKKEETISK